VAPAWFDPSVAGTEVADELQAAANSAAPIRIELNRRTAISLRLELGPSTGDTTATNVSARKNCPDFTVVTMAA